MATTEKSYRAEFDTEAEAQAMADKIHQHLIDTQPAYADSVAKGHTLRWDIPRRDRVPVDPANPFGDYVEVGGWKVSVPDYGTRDALGSLTAQESDKLDAAGKTARTAKESESLGAGK